MPKILLFCGSLRRDSYNRRLIHYLAKTLAGRCEVDMLETSEFTFPLYCEDLESSEELVNQVATVYERFNQADGVIIASPEYNGHVSSYLKNTIDWLSRIPGIHPKYYGEDAFHRKPIMLTSTSPGRLGGLRGVQNAKPLFDYLGCLVFPGELCVAFQEERFPKDRDNIDHSLAEYIFAKTENFLSIVRQMTKD